MKNNIAVTGGSFGRFISCTAPATVLLAALLAFWQQQCVARGIPEWMLAKPSDIFRALASGFSETVPYLANTCFNILAGFFLAVLIGMALAVLLTCSPLLAQAATPIMIVLCCVPMVTLVPLLLVMVSTGSAPKIIVIVLQSFAIVNMNASVGFAGVDHTRLELMQSMKATRLQQFRYCILRDAMPHIFTGVKLASVLSMISGVSAEMSGGSGGLGNYISSLVGYSRIPEAFACIIYIALLGLLLYGTISLLEKRLTRGMH